MREWYRRKLTGFRILQLLILTNIVYLIIVGITIPIVRAGSRGMELPDLMPSGYTYNYIKALLETLGEHGRYNYMFYQIPPDMLYPGLFAAAYSLVIAYFVNKLKMFDRPLFYLTILPLAGGFFDYCENFGIITLLNTFPSISVTAVQLTSLSTILKSIFSTLAFSTIIILIIVFGFRKLFHTKVHPANE